MLIPSFDIWDRAEFLRARWLQYESEKRRIEEAGESNVILVQPDRHIICDICSAEIVAPSVNVVNFGSKAACGDCFDRHFAGEPVGWKKVPDGE